MRTLTVILSLLSLASTLAAEPPKKCVVCDVALTGTFYWMSSPALAEKQPVCETCSKLDTVCAHCRLPLLKNFQTLDDGRLLCEKDYQAGVFTETEALRIFEAAKRDAQRILHGYGVMPDRNITVSLVNSNDLSAMNLKVPSWHQTAAVLGLTRTRRLPQNQFEHAIFLLNGLDPARLACVSAHEYAHAWIHENVPPERKLDPNTVEGFCELLAYKVAVERQDEIQKRIILANAYTRGQINAFVQAENEHQFHRVVHWMKTGVDPMLAQTNSSRFLAVKKDSLAPLDWPPPRMIQTPVPDILMLKGISGATGRRFVLINDRTLAQNESGRVRVGSSNVVVRCVEIKAGSAVIEVEGTETRVELKLAGM